MFNFLSKSWRPVGFGSGGGLALTGRLAVSDLTGTPRLAGSSVERGIYC